MCLYKRYFKQIPFHLFCVSIQQNCACMALNKRTNGEKKNIQAYLEGVIFTSKSTCAKKKYRYTKKKLINHILKLMFLNI